MFLLYRVRVLIAKSRFIQVNKLRSFLYEFGIVLPERRKQLFLALPHTLKNKTAFAGYADGKFGLVVATHQANC